MFFWIIELLFTIVFIFALPGILLGMAAGAALNSFLKFSQDAFGHPLLLVLPLWSLVTGSMLVGHMEPSAYPEFSSLVEIMANANLLGMALPYALIAIGAIVPVTSFLVKQFLPFRTKNN